jgi:protein disulfide-isomerase
MKNLKTLVLLVLLLAGFGSIAQKDSLKNKTEGLTWYTDIMKANEVSTATGKPLFAFFTGSDWCVWCKKLQSDVFSKPEFIAWAKEKVVLLELDFPRYKTLSPELQQQNAGLQQTFAIQGYPTIWLFYLTKNADNLKYDIKALGTLGYPQNTVRGKEQEKFINDAELLFKKVVK